MNRNPTPYDAILVVCFGGPEKAEDVMPFLENVTRGRRIPRERLLEVAEHYYHFGGKSPINEQTAAVIAELQKLLEREGPRLPIYWGNRNWHPLLADTVRQMAADGVKRAVAFVMAAWSSYSSCRQYRDNIEAARAECGADAPVIEKVRGFYNHPGFLEANADRVRSALAHFSAGEREEVEIVFTAHSIPVSMAACCEYEAQLQEASAIVASLIPHIRWKLVYQSRSGPPEQPWLGPDINDYLREAASTGKRSVVIAPIGFLSDHMEVLYDLDYEARQTCESLGIRMVRAGTVGTHPAFIAMIRELILETMGEIRTRRTLGASGPRPDVCPPGCCQPRPTSSPPASSPPSDR
jgi:ferrochelatase